MTRLTARLFVGMIIAVLWGATASASLTSQRQPRSRSSSAKNGSQPVKQAVGSRSAVCFGNVQAGSGLRISVKQEYRDAPGASVPLESVLTKLFTGAGIRVAPAGADVTLEVAFVGTPLGASYERRRDGIGTFTYCYSGASIQGTISMKKVGLEASPLKFSHTKGLVDRPAGCTENAANAPFESTLLGSDLLIQLASEVNRVYGEEGRFCYLAEAVGPAVADAEIKLIQTIASSGNPRAVAVLARVMASDAETWEAREHAARLIANGGPSAVEPLQRLVASRDESRRALALRSLGFLAEPRTRPLIQAGAGDRSEMVHVWGHFGLYRLGVGASLTQLGRYAAAGTDTERENAAEALALVNDQPAIEMLINALNPREHGFPPQLWLEKISGLRLGSSREKWLEWWEKNKHKFPARTTPKPS